MPFWSFCGKQSPSEPPSFLTIRDDFRTCESFIINKKLIVSVQIIFIREISEYKGSLSDKFSEQFHYYSNITQCLAAVIGSRKFNVWLSVHPRHVTFLEDSVSLDSHSKRSDPVPVPLNYYELQAWGNTKRREGRGLSYPREKHGDGCLMSIQNTTCHTPVRLRPSTTERKISLSQKLQTAN